MLSRTLLKILEDLPILIKCSISVTTGNLFEYVPLLIVWMLRPTSNPDDVFFYNIIIYLLLFLLLLYYSVLFTYVLYVFFTMSCCIHTFLLLSNFVLIVCFFFPVLM